MLPYFDPEYENFNQRINPPRVCIDNSTCSDCTLVKVDSMNKNGILLEVLQVLSDLDLHISKAYITSDGGWFMDVFHVLDKQGQKVTDTKTIQYIERVGFGSGEQSVRRKGQQLAGKIGGAALHRRPHRDRAQGARQDGPPLGDLRRARGAPVQRPGRRDVDAPDAGRLRRVRQRRGHGPGRRRRAPPVPDRGPAAARAPRVRRRRRPRCARQLRRRHDVAPGPAAAPAHARRRGRRRRRAGGRRHGGEAGGDGGVLRGKVLLGGERQVQGPVQAAVRHRVHAHGHAVRRVPCRRVLRSLLRRPGAVHPSQGRQDASERRSREGDQVPRSSHLQKSMRGLHAGAVRPGPGGPAVGRDEGAPGARPDGDPRRRDDGGGAGHERLLRARPLGQAGGHEDHRGAPRGGRPDRHAQRQEGARGHRQDAGARRWPGQDQLLLLRQPLRQAPGLINSSGAGAGPR